MRFSLAAIIGFVLAGTVLTEKITYDLREINENFGVRSRIINAEVNDEIEVLLKQNPTTGYAWLPLPVTSNSGIVNLKDEAYTPDQRPQSEEEENGIMGGVSMAG